MKFNHVIQYSDSQFKIPMALNVDGKHYTLENNEAEMLRGKLEEVYKAYIDSHVDNIKRS